MPSVSPLRIPTIDLSATDLKPGTRDWDSAKVHVMEALEEYGCFKAVYDKVPPELHNTLYASVQELFDLPLPTKIRIQSSKPYHGYIGQSPIAPLYETMAIVDAPIPEKAETFTNMLWPEGNASFSKTINLYSKGVSELDQLVRKIVLESLGVEKYYDEHIESSYYLFRANKYEGPKTDDTKLGLVPHTDKNIVTILSENQVNGLEVETKDGNWIDVKISPNSYVVMVGDCFLAWSNERLHSPRHRVMMTGNEARYSTGLFSIPNVGYLVKAPEELVDEENPLLFKPFDLLGYIGFCYTAEGQSCKSSLQTYCGVGYKS